MRHHPKSNNGVFSKKQRKSCRRLGGRHRGYLMQQDPITNLPTAHKSSAGIIATIAGILGMGRGRR